MRWGLEQRTNVLCPISLVENSLSCFHHHLVVTQHDLAACSRPHPVSHPFLIYTRCFIIPSWPLPVRFLKQLKETEGKKRPASNLTKGDCLLPHRARGSLPQQLEGSAKREENTWGLYRGWGNGELDTASGVYLHVRNLQFLEVFVQTRPFHL